MSGVVTNNFRVFNAKQFYENFSEANTANIYGFIGRSFAWSDDNSPDAPTDTINLVRFDTWRQMMSLKKITSTDVSFCVPRSDWTTGTVYDQYTAANSALWASDFFVLTEDYNVYKCLSNNKGATSTVKPTGTSTGRLITSDGYVWKYMFTISAPDAVKFLTSDFMPVKTLESDDGSAQWDVQAAAVDGACEVIHVDTAGTSYTSHTGTAQAGASATITLASGASSVNGTYTNMSIYISSGTGAGQIRKIINYVGSTKVATVNSNWSTPPDSSSVYLVSPTVHTLGDGTGFSAYSTVSGGGIAEIRVLNEGADYTWISADIVSNAGSGALLRPELSPTGGHGSDPVTELAGHNVIINLKIQGSESNTFTVANDFRIIGLIADPLLANGSPATSSVYDQMPKINVTSISGTFVKDEVVVGQTSSANGYMIELTANNDMRFNNVYGTYTVAETVRGQTSNATATVVSYSGPAMDPYSGDVLYIEHRGAVSRNATQSEKLALVIQF